MPGSEVVGGEGSTRFSDTVIKKRYSTAETEGGPSELDAGRHTS